MTDRRIFNHPIRKETTLEFFPEKITIERFKEVICDSFEDYAKNAKNQFDQPKYIEEWAEQYLTWLEIEEER